MVSAFYNLESPMHIWDDMQRCYATSHDEETHFEVEIYLPPQMAHWFGNVLENYKQINVLFLL
eukprot:5761004-Prorocentrum_lima.AAC.1